MVLPTKAFLPGEYFWKWSAGGKQSEVFSFTITPEATVLEVPPAAEWLKRFPSGHPRTYIRPEDIPALRQSRHGERAEMWKRLHAAAEELLPRKHEIEEPPTYPTGASATTRSSRSGSRSWSNRAASSARP
ncbi:MAG: hypothetical protein B1H04_05300 [Planctomycetales bacterium 4484_123]|nr:MAG: hypothetical protein B1H04_05300 [Planctomycetales bacterium 4484_123]